MYNECMNNCIMKISLFKVVQRFIKLLHHNLVSKFALYIYARLGIIDNIEIYQSLIHQLGNIQVYIGLTNQLGSIEVDLGLIHRLGNINV